MKTYMIVTNDEFETPVAVNLHGTKAVSEYLGISKQTIWNNISRKKWSKKYKHKAIVDESVEPIRHDFKAYQKRYTMTHDRTEYFRQYYLKKKEGYEQWT